MSDCIRVTECRLCDSRELELIYSFTPTPPGDQYLREPKPQTCYPLDLMICRGCGAVQLADTLDPSLIYPDYIYRTSISPGLDAHFDRYAKDVLERVQPKAGGYVVDIGSNDGTLLRAFKARGYEVLGVDPATAIAEQATAAGIPTCGGWFTQQTANALLATYGHASLITANHVMANVADLHDWIEGVKTLLAPDGTFVFETGYWPAIRDNRLIDTIEHEHIHYFSVPSLCQFFSRHGLELVDAETNSTKGGALRGFVKHGKGIGVLAWDTSSVTPAWAQQIDALKTQLAVVIARKPKSERWVGYGSAVGSTLLCHHFGFGEVLTELWDDNASRHGLYSPGFHLPVCAPSRGSASKVVILAWRYAEMIMQRHPEYRGQFLIPLPDVRVA